MKKRVMIDGNNIKKYRLLKDLTQGELGAAVEITKQAVSKIENGSTTSISFDKLMAISFALGVDMLNLCKIEQQTNEVPNAYKSLCECVKGLNDKEMGLLLDFCEYIKYRRRSDK